MWHYLFIFLIVFLVINMVVAIVVESFEENFEFRSKNPYLEDSIIKTGVIFCIVHLMPITSRLDIRQVLMLMTILWWSWRRVVSTAHSAITSPSV